MSKKEQAASRIDKHFEKAEPFARAICNKLRALIHNTDPEIRESWKWGPAFEKNELALGIWPFKKHVSMVFFHGAEMSDRHGLFTDGFKNKHNRMIKFRELDEIREDELRDYIREAISVAQKESKEGGPARKLAIPDVLKKELDKDSVLKERYEDLAYTYRKEFAYYIEDAKRDETKQRRLKKVIQSLQKGKKLRE